VQAEVAPERQGCPQEIVLRCDLQAARIREHELRVRSVDEPALPAPSETVHDLQARNRLLSVS
jgi:hypothetical protein